MGLSISAVSKALNDYPDMNEDTKKAVADKAIELGYSPNLIARSLVKNSSNVIGFVVRDISNIYGDLFKMLSKRAEQLNLNLLVGDSNRNAKLELSHIKNMIDSRVKGIIISPTSDITTIKECVNNRVPIVFVGGSITSATENFVSSDNRYGTGLAMDYLFGLGHKNIAFISDSIKSNSTKVKCDTYIRRMRENGLEPMVFRDDINDEDLISAGCRQVRALFESGKEFSAILSSKDKVALGAMKELKDHGLHVPEDVSVMGYDGLEIASMPMIELTTISHSQTASEIADNLLRILLSQAESGRGAEPEHYYAKPKLIIRNSCRRIGEPFSAKK